MAFRHRFRAIVLSVILAVGAGTTPSAAVDLLSHRALYQMNLGTVSPGSKVVAADGVMVYRFEHECTGWTLENRTYLRIAYEGQADLETVWSFASWESEDGTKFRFHTRYDQDGKTVEQLEGSAQLDRPGGGGLATFTSPEERDVVLPVGTLFPTAHTRLLINAARAGLQQFTATLFDGASPDNPYLVSAVIGPVSTEEADALAAIARLPKGPAWWTRMAYFPLDSLDPEPEFEIGGTYRADGVADRIVQQFDDFTLNVRLKELETLPPPDC